MKYSKINISQCILALTLYFWSRICLHSAQRSEHAYLCSLLGRRVPVYIMTAIDAHFSN